MESGVTYFQTHWQSPLRMGILICFGGQETFVAVHGIARSLASVATLILGGHVNLQPSTVTWRLFNGHEAMVVRGMNVKRTRTPQRLQNMRYWSGCATMGVQTIQ